MTPTMVKRAPVHSLAWAALVTGLVASALALYGSFLSERHLDGSPLNTARNAAGLESTRASTATRYGLQFVAYFLPFVLGVGAALAGGEAMRAVERHGERYSGSRHAVFAIMIGGLSAVVSGCMILAVFVWEHVPAGYSY
ncbi:MAG: hypothetical protein JWO38_2695 [Gemmataceae bacterium]|nr:hypothetical protein [Gemmataceae bacterium]